MASRAGEMAFLTGETALLTGETAFLTGEAHPSKPPQSRVSGLPLSVIDSN